MTTTTEQQRVGDRDTHGMLQVQLHLLERIALAPRSVHLTRARLIDGLVLLDFHRINNPCPFFVLRLGSEELRTLQEAVECNVRGDLFQNAERALEWHSPKRVIARRRFEVSVMEDFKAGLDWPEPPPYGESTDIYRTRYAIQLSLIDQKLAAVRDLRMDRIERLHRAAAPGCDNWHALVADCERVAEQAPAALTRERMTA